MTRPLVAIALALSACGTHTAERNELADAQTQVRRFFDAIASGDCPTLGSLVPAINEREACAKLLHEWRDDLRIKLIDLPDARRDGRDRGAIIVRATVLRREQQQTMLVRVTHEKGVWQLVL